MESYSLIHCRTSYDWALGRYPEDPAKVQELMTTCIAGEMTAREPHDGVFDLPGPDAENGGVPERDLVIGASLY